MAIRYNNILAALSNADPQNSHLVVQVFNSATRLFLVDSICTRITEVRLSLLVLKLRRLGFLRRLSKCAYSTHA